jgi:hypothetical protein
MGVAVNFDYNGWIQAYPNFSYVPIELAQTYFNIATSYLRNDGGGVVNNPVYQDMYLKMIMSHLAQLLAPDAQGQPASSIVGRITNASEGSVSVASEMSGPDAAAFWYQTKYGAMFWNATKQYRTMRWKRGRVRRIEPWFVPFGPGW